ncbi:class I SAM-dependent methyltransferase [Methylomonas sp. MK1]|uniref:class I SAM-dependent methyltransferase n=1 Tax=Methylomonas sp. MK1 TaxID=1131552 RepID=UPI00035D0AE4|nr:class I SAM-dependent methyltransferase [Methylomonas sp. MK1]
MNRAVFKRNDILKPISDFEEIFQLDNAYVWEYLKGTNDTPIRALTDKVINALMPYLENDGKIIELGAGTDFYKSMAPVGQEYLTSNFISGFDLQLDMTNLALEDSSIDAFISLYAIEHIFDFEKTIKETYRCLKPGGRCIIVSPFLYYYHAAPDDYFRFTMSALERLFSDFNVLIKLPLGNREMLMAEFYLELDVMGFESSTVSRLMRRFIGALFCAKGISAGSDSKFAAANLILCEKK